MTMLPPADVFTPSPDLEVLEALQQTVAVGHDGTAVARAAEVLRRAVVTGILRAGTRLPEESLAAALDVSRNSLRAAFDELEEEHLLTRERNRGVQVAQPDESTVRHIYRSRLALEGAALRWPESRARDEAAERMRRAVRAGRSARGTGDVAGMAEANDAFHRAVVSLSGSERQLAMMARVQAEVRLVFHTLDDRPTFHSPWVERNAALTELVEQERDAQAADLIGEYLRDSSRMILRLWEAMED